MNNEQKDKDVKRSNSYLKNNKANPISRPLEDDIIDVDLPKSKSRRKVNADRDEKVNISSQQIVQ